MPRRFNRRSRSRRPRRRRFVRRRGRPRRRRRLMLDPEQKFLDNFVEHLPTQAGVITFLNGSPQGIDANTRMGIQQLNTSLYLKYQCLIDPAVNVPTTIRVAIVLELRPVAQLPNIDQIWTANNTAFAAISSRALDTALKFKILYQKTIVLDLANQLKKFTWFRKLNLVTRYATPNGGIADVTSGALYFVSISDNANNPPQVRWQCRTRFVG